MTTSDATTQTLAELGISDFTHIDSLLDEFKNLDDRFEQDCTAVLSDPTAWTALRDKWLGRKSGILTRIKENWLEKTANRELKRQVGQSFNERRLRVTARIEELHASLDAVAEQSALARDKIDLSLPGIERSIGTRHLIRQTYDELLRIFTAIGFSVVAGPEIETPYYNFEALNIPEHHPARDNMDTFYIAGARGGHLLRTHTSPCRFAPWRNRSRRCASWSREKFIAAIIRTRRTATCSTRSKAWPWIRTSLSAISRAPWIISRANSWAPRQKRACGPAISPSPSLRPKWTQPATFAPAPAAACASSPAGSNFSARAW